MGEEEEGGHTQRPPKTADSLPGEFGPPSPFLFLRIHRTALGVFFLLPMTSFASLQELLFHYQSGQRRQERRRADERLLLDEDRWT